METQAHSVDEPKLRFPYGMEKQNAFFDLFWLIVKTSLSSFVPLPHPGEFISPCYEQ